MQKRSILAAAALVAVITTAAYAAVTIDPETGLGFVGKGDVQMPFGWNNARLQSNAGGVTFSFDDLEIMEQDCADNDQGEFTVVGQRTKTKSIASQIAYDARVKNQITGFLLNGFDGQESVSPEQWVGPNGETSGNACPAGSQPHGAPRKLTSSGYGLSAHYNGESHVIWTQGS